MRYGCPYMYDGNRPIGRNEATGSRSRPSRRLNANGNTLDEKGKKYGSFNPTSVNSFCPVAGGVGTHLRWGILTRPQVGDFQVAIGGQISGIPRSINLLCNAALVYGFAVGAKTIGKEMTTQIQEDKMGVGLGLDATESLPKSKWGRSCRKCFT